MYALGAAGLTHSSPQLTLLRTLLRDLRRWVLCCWLPAHQQLQRLQHACTPGHWTCGQRHPCYLLPHCYWHSCAPERTGYCALQSIRPAWRLCCTSRVERCCIFITAQAHTGNDALKLLEALTRALIPVSVRDNVVYLKCWARVWNSAAWSAASGYRSAAARA